MRRLLAVDPKEVRQQLPQVEADLAQFGDDLPGEIRAQLTASSSASPSFGSCLMASARRDRESVEFKT